VAAAQALRDGVQAAIQVGFRRLIVEANNLIVVQALKS